MFRFPDPIIEKIDPVEQPAGPTARIRVYGRQFRPYLRMMVSPTGHPFTMTGARLGEADYYAQTETAQHVAARALIESPTAVEYGLPFNLRPGQYDIHLYDQFREVARRVAAFTLKPEQMSESWVNARVRFVGGFDAAIVRAGAVDLNPDSSDPKTADERVAVLTSIRSAAKTSGSLDGYFHTPIWIVEADLRIPVRRRTTEMWTYRSQPLQLGGAFSFQTARYALRGTILAVDWTPLDAGQRSGHVSGDAARRP
jgi:hypothetical protein